MRFLLFLAGCAVAVALLFAWVAGTAFFVIQGITNSDWRYFVAAFAIAVLGLAIITYDVSPDKE